MNKYGTFGSQEGVEAEITRLKSQYQIDLRRARENLARHRQNGWPTRKADLPERITGRYEQRLAGLYNILSAEPIQQGDLEEAVETAVMIEMPVETTLETAVEVERSAAESPVLPTGEVTYSSSLRAFMKLQRRIFDGESVRYKSLKERHLQREAMYGRYAVLMAVSDVQLRIQAANERLSADDRKMLEETLGGLARTTTEEQYLSFLPPEN